MNKRDILWAIIFSVFFTLIFFNQFVLNLNKIPSQEHGDYYLVNFTVHNVVSKIAAGNFGQIPNLPMFYGFKNTLFFSDNYIAQAILDLPIYLFIKDPILNFNILILVTFILSFFSMYLLAFHFTKNVLGSVLASVIYIFNPFVMNHFPDRLQIYSLEFLPLIFLFLERSLKKNGSLNIFLFFIFLTVQLFSGIYYAVFLTIILPIYIVIRFFQEKIRIRIFLNKGLVVGIIIFVLVTLGLGLMYKSVLKYSPDKDISKDIERMSPFVSDFLFTKENNFLYGSLRAKAFQVNSSFFSSDLNFNQNLFWGLVPLTIFLCNFFIVKKPDNKSSTNSVLDKKFWLAWTVLIFVSIIFCFGPKVHLSKDISFVGPYALIEKLNPIISQINRDPARFAVFIFLFLGLVCALTIKRYKFLTIAAIILVLIEYSIKMPRTLTISNDQKNFYNTLEAQKHIQVIANLPIGEEWDELPNGKVKYYNIDSRYLLDATILHNKKLINGYNGFEPDDYFKRVAYLRSDLPLPLKIANIKKWGAQGLVLHGDLFYNMEQYDEMKKEVLSLGYPVLAQTKKLILFGLTK